MQSLHYEDTVVWYYCWGINQSLCGVIVSPLFGSIIGRDVVLVFISQCMWVLVSHYTSVLIRHYVLVTCCACIVVLLGSCIAVLLFGGICLLDLD